MSLRVPQQLRGIKRKAEQQGWTITVRGSGHHQWTPPYGDECVIVSGTRLGSGRSLENTISKLKSKGLRL